MAIWYYCDMCGVEMSDSFFDSSPGLALYYKKASKIVNLSESMCDDCIESMKEVLKEKSKELKLKRKEAGWNVNADT